MIDIKQSYHILLFTGTCAAVAMLLAWILGGKQEDTFCAIGGAAGFLLANGLVRNLRNAKALESSNEDSAIESASIESGIVYAVFAIAFFAFIGWLTGCLHQHGELAGTASGALGGFILATIVPAIHRMSFMAAGRRIQLALSVVAFGAIIAIVWSMYKHEFQ